MISFCHIFKELIIPHLCCDFFVHIVDEKNTYLVSLHFSTSIWLLPIKNASVFYLKIFMFQRNKLTFSL